jgi:hypothetical protein
VIQCCIAVRESGEFSKPISSNKIGALLGIDPKTVWTHWAHFQKYGLARAATGCPTILTDAQLDSIISHAMDQFFAGGPMGLSRLATFTRSEYAVGINPDTLRHGLMKLGPQGS